MMFVSSAGAVPARPSPWRARVRSAASTRPAQCTVSRRCRIVCHELDGPFPAGPSDDEGEADSFSSDNSSSSGNSDSGSGSNDIPDSELPVGKRIVKALELSFVRVWIALSFQGVGELYEDALKTFVMATIAAYEHGFSLPALQLELQVHSAFQEKAEQLGLTEQEIRKIRLSELDRKTRDFWLLLVYLTLAELKHTPPNPPPRPPEDVMKVMPLVKYVCEQHKRGFSFEGMKLEAAMRQQTSSEPEINDNPMLDAQRKEMERRSRAQASLRSQWMRIAYITATEAAKPKS